MTTHERITDIARLLPNGLKLETLVDILEKIAEKEDISFIEASTEFASVYTKP